MVRKGNPTPILGNTVGRDSTEGTNLSSLGHRRKKLWFKRGTGIQKKQLQNRAKQQGSCWKSLVKRSWRTPQFTLPLHLDVQVKARYRHPSGPWALSPNQSKPSHQGNLSVTHTGVYLVSSYYSQASCQGDTGANHSRTLQAHTILTLATPP